MKLATYHDGSRDGQLVVVSRDLASAHYTSGIATRLQQVLDDWNFLSPQLEDLSTTLNHGRARHAFPFEPQKCMAPLPRAYQWVVGSAYLSRVELLRKAQGGELPPSLYGEPLMARGGSDHFDGPCQDAVFASAEAGIDFEAGLAAITGDVAPGTPPAQALEGLRLLMLANDWSLRALLQAEAARGAPGCQGWPATAFSPVAVTPDELGEAWQGGRVHLTLQTTLNDRKVGLCEAGPEMSFHFGQLLAHLAKTRALRAGTIVGSGAVGNQDASKGCNSIAERRALETLEHGEPRTPFLQFGDTVRIEMKGRDGLSVFGAIEQTLSDPA
ncbi:MAG TPA: fumarylacetoacetate hydrolase family protein [Ideonella sp.]|nr:fumarylacetoacetate hydrolase family protein [Ideonella sp.]